VSYSLKLGAAEIARYRFMAARARESEGDLWERVGVVAGARVADVGCGPGSVLELLAEIVGAEGHVSGVDGDPQAVAAAETVVDGAENVDLRVGRADATGLEPGTFDVVMLRHVLAHNGGVEQEIVDHLASLVRPSGCVYLVDVDISLLRISPMPDDLGDFFERYVEFHRGRGNDPHVGLRLGDYVKAAGLEQIELRGRFDITPLPVGLRPPPLAAAEEMLAQHVVGVDDIRRWNAAFEQMDGESERPTLFNPTFIAVGRRPN
jgi:SAM-dependent methyltransferase